MTDLQEGSLVRVGGVGPIMRIKAISADREDAQCFPVSSPASRKTTSFKLATLVKYQRQAIGAGSGPNPRFR